jgi:hypothetical protein
MQRQQNTCPQGAAVGTDRFDRQSGHRVSLSGVAAFPELRCEAARLSKELRFGPGGAEEGPLKGASSGFIMPPVTTRRPVACPAAMPGLHTCMHMHFAN